MPWSKRIRPISSGMYWYRESPDDQPTRIEVTALGRFLYVQLPAHTEGVPIEECDGEWNLLFDEEQDAAQPLERDYNEMRFRRGACHSIEWVKTEMLRLFGAGATREEMVERVTEFEEILINWRNCYGDMPRGNPWEWSARDLDAYIGGDRGNWGSPASGEQGGIVNFPEG